MMRINVIGTSGSGKSTLSKRLASQLDIPYIEMDQLFWGPNWQMPRDEAFYSRLELALDQDYWVLDGNYTRTTPIKWSQTQLVIWVDYSFTRTLLQALKRATVRIATRKELWPNTGNRETLRKLFSKDSIIWWTVSNFRKNRRKYVTMMYDSRYAHIRFVRLRSPADAERLLSDLRPEGDYCPG
ncbi:shikimate kinase [Spongorhabdus nitratireducens]